MIARAVSTILKRSFKPFVFESGAARDTCAGVARLGIYVHIPFCRSICRFCPYYKVQYNPDLVGPFVRSLRSEIRDLTRIGSTHTGGRTPVTSVYFGGGTPALLIEHLSEVMHSIDDRFEVAGPRGIELHPDDITVQTLTGLRGAGFTMLSLGMQSFQAHSLQALGRRQEDLSNRITLARELDFRVVDCDLIFGIPGQTPHDLAEDFRTAASAGATQISTYPFIDFSYADNPRKPMGRRGKRRMLEAILEVSRDLDFERTSVWTFARKGTGRYSSVTRDNYLGFGPGAASLLPSSFSLNVFSVAEYIRAVSEGRSPTAFAALLGSRERMLLWLFWHAYNLTVERSAFAELFGCHLDSRFGTELRVAKGLGLLVATPDGYRLTERGAYLFHLAEQLYTTQYIDRIWRLATQTPWPRRFVIW